MKIKLASLEAGISAIGFRKISAIARSIEPSTEICFIPSDNLYSFISHISPYANTSIRDEDLDIIAHYLAQADIVGFSSMTVCADFVEKLSKSIRQINPKIYLIWGGVHPTLYAEDAIKVVDAICIGEGEQPMKIFTEGLLKGQFLTTVPNMWFKKNDIIIKNQALPLNSSDILSQLPHSFNNNDCLIYDQRKKQFRSFDKLDYAHFNGLLFRTVWILGCPFSCSYCANDSFIKLDSEYRKLRYPSVDYIIEEIKLACTYYPFISTIAFYDDNFIALPISVIEEFCVKYKKEINRPFVVFGLHPNLITKEKIELLASVGMNRARMGIQSGSVETLTFFNRHTSIEKILESSTILADAARKYKMIPPAYDIISDNPVDNRQNIIETLELIYKIKRPFTLTVFSLRVFPKTQLFEYVATNPKLLEYFKDSSYLDTRMTINNVTLYLLGICNPPKFIFDKLIALIKKENSLTKNRPILFRVVKYIYLIKRGIDHILKFDFSTIVGSWTYYLWKIKTLILKHNGKHSRRQRI